MSKTFRCEYPFTCGCCGARVPAGSLVQYHESDLMHVSCARQSGNTDVCSDCNMTKPCECD